MSSEQVEAISKLPARNDLYAMFMGTINAPLTNLVYAMSGITGKFMQTLQALAESQGKQ